MISAVICSVVLLPLYISCQSVPETPLQNPAFVNPAPCSCDLTANIYDNNCCCDPDAEGFPDVIAISNCIQGNFGGNFTFIDDNLCRNDQSYTTDWFPFTCIQFLNSPSLGLYYFPAVSIISESPQINTFTYDRSLASTVTMNLTLPQNSIDGNCVWRSPVQYLVDSTASCDVTVDAQLCSSGTKLDPDMYIPLTGSGAPFDVEPSNITYFCASSLNDPLFVKTNAGRSSVNSTESLFEPTTSLEPTQCVPDSIQTSGSSCLNAVAAVNYVFTWNASSVVDFQIIFTLANVSFTELANLADGTGPNFVLTQQFSAMFTPNVTAGDPTPQSGNPGYEVGLPVISGVPTAGNVDTATGLKIWKQGSSGLCADSTKADPRFGHDTITGCNIAFSYYNCSLLRTLIEDQQIQLINATVVSRFGNPSLSETATDWMNIISNLTGFAESNVTEEGFCEGIPSQVNLEFLWARSGEQSGQAVREIVGAKVSWTRETWQIFCVEGDAACPVKIYTVYSSVEFTEVPAQPPAPLTTYELSRNDSCRMDATCWPELLLPIQSEFFYQFDIATADILRAYNFRWALLITFFTILAALVPAHWSSVGRYLKQALPL